MERRKIAQIADLLRTQPHQKLEVETDKLTFRAALWEKYGKSRIYISQNTDKGCFKRGYIDVQTREMFGEGEAINDKLAYVELSIETLRTYEIPSASELTNPDVLAEELRTQSVFDNQ